MVRRVLTFMPSVDKESEVMDRESGECFVADGAKAETAVQPMMIAVVIDCSSCMMGLWILMSALAVDCDQLTDE